MIKLCFIDTETTGVSPKAGIWQIGGIIRYMNEVDLVPQKEQERFLLQCDIFEDDEVDEKVLEMHDLTLAALSKLGDPGEAYADLIKVFERHVDRYDKKDKMFFIGYGAEFDYKALRHWFSGFGDDFFGSWFWMPWLDVMTIAANALRFNRHELPNFQLKTVADYLKIEVAGEKYHNALYDAEVAMHIFDMMANGFFMPTEVVPVAEKEAGPNADIRSRQGRKKYILNKQRKSE